jgi:hypothetical protein
MQVKIKIRHGQWFLYQEKSGWSGSGSVFSSGGKEEMTQGADYFRFLQYHFYGIWIQKTLSRHSVECQNRV